MRIENMNIANPLRGHDLRGRKSAKTEGAAPSFDEQITRQSVGDTASASTSAAVHLPAASVSISGEEYLRLQQESAAANNAEVRSAAEHKALIAATDNAAFENTSVNATTDAPVTDPQEIVDRLSDSSRATLEAMKAGRDVSKSQWTMLCKEMKDMGAITEDDFNSVRTDIQIVPAGYELHPVMVRELKAMYARSQGIYVETEMWTGDPFEYLTSWQDLMDEWQDMLVTIRDENGARKYTDFSPIREQVNSCQKVSELVKNLIEEERA